MGNTVKTLDMETTKLCTEPTISWFTNCTALLVYNPKVSQVYYTHVSPMGNIWNLQEGGRILTEFLENGGPFYAIRVSRSNSLTSLRWAIDILKNAKIPYWNIQLPITDKLDWYRYGKGIDIAWCLEVHPYTGTIIFKDRSIKDEAVEVPFPTTAEETAEIGLKFTTLSK